MLNVEAFIHSARTSFLDVKQPLSLEEADSESIFFADNQGYLGRQFRLAVAKGLLQKNLEIISAESLA
jgi:hypothetical protein